MNKRDGKQIFAEDIIEMCRSVTDNEQIAKFYNCEISIVKMLRKVMEGKTFSFGKRPVENSLYNDDEDDKNFNVALRSADKKEKQDALDGSKRLLARQLEAGQHWLTKDQFIKMATELGLQDRLPKGAKNEATTKRLPPLSSDEKFKTLGY